MQPTSPVTHEVVLCNFGGPTSAEHIEPFLLKLFEDPFIIRAPLGPRLRGWLARRIARKRAPKALAEYRTIGFSPINRMTDIQARQLETLLQRKHPGTRVHVANRYTAPFAADVVPKLDLQASRLFILTLYPHLCHSTTVSSLRDFDLAWQAHHGHMNQPSTRVFSWWHHPRYLAHSFGQLRSALTTALAEQAGPVTVMFSAHGIPDRYFRRGDPYVTEIQGHCRELERRAEEWLAGFEGGKHRARLHWQLSFQSRVGPVEWVRPYTDESIATLGRDRKGGLVIVPISFTSDHIETLYEMDHTYRQLALASGFTHVTRATPSNDDPELAACLADILDQYGF